VYNGVILPELTHVRFIISSDVTTLIQLFSDSSDSASICSSGSDGSSSVEAPDLHSEMSDCLHEDHSPYPEDSEDVGREAETMCDLASEGEPHLAFSDGLSPTVCNRCFAVMCRNCQDHLDYDSGAPISNTPSPVNSADSSDME